MTARPQRSRSANESGRAPMTAVVLTVGWNRSFVLGSDELYREWGYTAMCRHREHTWVRSSDERTITSAHLDEGWLDHAYALTAHTAHGATVELGESSECAACVDLGSCRSSPTTKAAAWVNVSPSSTTRRTTNSRHARTYLTTFETSLHVT
jgi:hypothetical protein